MKIYKKKKDALIRIRITKKGELDQYLTLVDTNQQETFEYLCFIIENVKVPVTAFKGGMTNIQIREAIGGKNLKAISFSFKGLSTRDTYNLIVESINKLQNGKEKD